MTFCPTSGKIVYVNRADAASELHHVNRRRKSEKGKQRLHPYFCTACGGYHLGREKPNDRRSR